MRMLKINGKEYNIEYSFEAAEYKSCVEKAFQILSGGYLTKRNSFDDKDEREPAELKKELAAAFVDGTADMFSDIPQITITFLYAGLLENNPVESENSAKALFKQFSKENPDDDRASFFGMYTFLRDCMEEDGFFKLTGLEKMIAEMMATAKEQAAEVDAQKSGKIPTDHKRKSTSTK